MEGGGWRVVGSGGWRVGSGGWRVEDASGSSHAVVCHWLIAALHDQFHDSFKLAVLETL